MDHGRLLNAIENRKDVPMVRGLLDYFPDALTAVANASLIGNEKHNPGEEVHWARGKSTDQADCILRHLTERGGFDPETGVLHSTWLAWRALALLQLELEALYDLPLPRGATSDASSASTQSPLLSNDEVPPRQPDLPDDRRIPEWTPGRVGEAD